MLAGKRVHGVGYSHTVEAPIPLIPPTVLIYERTVFCPELPDPISHFPGKSPQPRVPPREENIEERQRQRHCGGIAPKLVVMIQSGGCHRR